MGIAVLPVLGLAGGFMVGGTTGAAIGSILASSLASKGRDTLSYSTPIDGPRMTELRIQVSSYGEIIPQVYGRVRLAGNVIWNGGIREHKHTHTNRQTYRTGGKGGGGRTHTQVQTHHTYTYTASCAIGICAGEIDEVVRIWANGKLQHNKKWRVYKGCENQIPDPLVARSKSYTPAYRGLAYVVFQDYPLGEFGNRLPNFSFEVKKKP